MILFCSNYWQNPQIAAAVHYFHYKSHHHYHCHHFHCHCKIHLYCLRTLLTIRLNCNMIPCLFPLNFVCFLPTYIFLQSYSKLYAFCAQRKDSEFTYNHQTYFRCFLYLHLYLYPYLFTLPYLHLYLFPLIYTNIYVCTILYLYL